MEKMFMALTSFYYRFYMCVQIYITVERIIKIFVLFWAYGPLKQEAKCYFLMKKSMRAYGM